jgi:hypothetical protein
MLFSVTQITGMAKRLWTDLTTARAAKLDNLTDAVSTMAPGADALSAVDFSATRAAKLDNLDGLLSSLLSGAVNSIQKVSLSCPVTNGIDWSGTRTISAVNTAKTILIWLNNGNREEGGYSMRFVDVWLANSTTLNIDGKTAFTTSSFHPGSVLVVEFK